MCVATTDREKEDGGEKREDGGGKEMSTRVNRNGEKERKIVRRDEAAHVFSLNSQNQHLL